MARVKDSCGEYESTDRVEATETDEIPPSVEEAAEIPQRDEEGAELLTTEEVAAKFSLQPVLQPIVTPPIWVILTPSKGIQLRIFQTQMSILVMKKKRQRMQMFNMMMQQMRYERRSLCFWIRLVLRYYALVNDWICQWCFR